MKVRNGFVSNSSTSSFILMTRKRNYKDILPDLDPYVRAVVEGLKRPAQFEHGKMIVLGYIMGAGDGPLDFFDPDFDGDVPVNEHGDKMTPYEAIEEYWKALTEVFGDAAVFSYSQDG